MSLKIDVQVIPHKDQRYNTVGDWWFDNYHFDASSVWPEHTEEILRIRVSELGDWRYEIAVALHEQYEALLCYHDGVTEKQVSDYDQEYETKVKNNVIFEDKYMQEPGDMADAPYYKQHAKALVLEHMFLADTDVVRYLYNEAMDELYRPVRK